jgi:hypothetical protein
MKKYIKITSSNGPDIPIVPIENALNILKTLGITAPKVNDWVKLSVIEMAFEDFEKLPE